MLEGLFGGVGALEALDFLELVANRQPYSACTLISSVKEIYSHTIGPEASFPVFEWIEGHRFIEGKKRNRWMEQRKT